MTKSDIAQIIDTDTWTYSRHWVDDSWHAVALRNAKMQTVEATRRAYNLSLVIEFLEEYLTDNEQLNS